MLTASSQQLTAEQLAERRAAVDRILASAAFRNTETLKRLLDYLAGRALLGQADALKEYTIGLEAFGKPASYDPKIDSSVRVQAGKLRAKLDEYHRGEGADNPIVVELPKGHFTLSFEERAAPSPVVVQPALPPAPKSGSLVPWIVASASVAIALGAGVFAWRAQSHVAFERQYLDRSVRELWAPVLGDSRPAAVSLGAPLFSRMNGALFRDPSLNTWDAASVSERLHRIETILGGKANPVYPYTGVGEATAAFELARLFLAAGKDLHIVASNNLTWDDIGRQNVIFVGPPKFNMQTTDLPVRQDFIIHHAHIENRNPRPGEPKIFSETWASDHATLIESHAVVGRLPGLHGSGKIMILASTSTEGTRAAVDFALRPEYAAKLNAAANGAPWFEAVIRATIKGQTPIRMELAAFHRLE